jgi:hypothetical protein
MKQKLNKSIKDALASLRDLSSEKTSLTESEKVEERKPKKGEGRKDVEERKKASRSSDNPSIDRLSRIVSSQKKTAAQRLKEQGVDLETLLSGDEEEVETGDEEEGVKKGKLVRKPLKDCSKGNPHPTPPAVPALLDLDTIVESMPEDSKDLNRSILSYLTKLQYVALAKAEQMLLNPAVLESPSELIKLATALRDMQLTIKWTKKMEQVILNNPSKMKPPGVGGSFRLLDKVAMFAKQTKQESEIDKRNSGYQNSRPAAHELDVPADDNIGKKVEGA